MSVEATAVGQAIEAVRAELNLDRRSSVYEVHEVTRDGVVTLTGHTTESAAVELLCTRINELPGVRHLEDEVVRLPRGVREHERYAVIRAAVAPLYQEPRIPLTQITQLVMGNRVELLSRETVWWRVRGDDGYIGWVHFGYLTILSEDLTEAWGRGGSGEPVVSLGAELVDQDSDVLARLPWGARAVHYSGQTYGLPDGRRGSLSTGELIPVARLYDLFPPQGAAIIRTARRWLGAPYLWGGVSMGGVDCSGLAQAVLFMHGIALPRDSDLQARVGAAIEPGTRFENLRAADLLFFSENGERVTHVALSLGNGSIIHASLTNAEVAINDMNGDSVLEEKLRAMFTHARRVLPD